MKRMISRASIYFIISFVGLTPTHAQTPFHGETALAHRDFSWRSNPRLRDGNPNARLFAKPALLHPPSDSVKVAWVQQYASQLAPSWDEAQAVAVDRAGNTYVTGFSTKLPYGLDCLTDKYQDIVDKKSIKTS
jgi:hypothetical protein